MRCSSCARTSPGRCAISATAWSKRSRRSASLAKQLADASESIALNLGEGRLRHAGDKRRHFEMAAGSASEVTVALRIAQMSGWVSQSLMALWSNIGEVEDGMRTLTPAHAITDAPGAQVLGRVKGEVRFEAVSFAYGREKGGIDGVDLAIKPGERIGIVGASGAGKSSLLGMFALSIRPTSGGLSLFGTEVTELARDELPLR
mgnify:CR=1 FL=1